MKLHVALPCDSRVCVLLPMGYETQWLSGLIRSACSASAASSMIYVSIADLIPGLHKKTELRSTVFQVALIVLGVASVALTQLIVEG